MYGVKFNDLKMIVEFMYRGEIKVQDEDIRSLLALAENLQIKGLSNVRVKTDLDKIEKSEQEKPQPEAQRAVKRRKSSFGVSILKFALFLIFFFFKCLQFTIH